MKHNDFDLDLKKVLVDENEIEASARIIMTTTIILSYICSKSDWWYDPRML